MWSFEKKETTIEQSEAERNFNTNESNDGTNNKHKSSLQLPTILEEKEIDKSSRPSVELTSIRTLRSNSLAESLDSRPRKLEVTAYH